MHVPIILPNPPKPNFKIDETFFDLLVLFITTSLILLLNFFFAISNGLRFCLHINKSKESL